MLVQVVEVGTTNVLRSFTVAGDGLCSELRAKKEALGNNPKREPERLDYGGMVEYRFKRDEPGDVLLYLYRSGFTASTGSPSGDPEARPEGEYE